VTSCFLRKLQRIVIYLDIVFISLDYLHLSENNVTKACIVTYLKRLHLEQHRQIKTVSL